MFLSRSIELVQRSAAAPAAVWAVLTDIPAAAAHLSGVDRIEVLTPGEYTTGYRWRETRTMLGKAVTEEMTVAVVDAPRRTVVEAESAGVQYYSEFNLVDDGAGGTVIRMTFTGELIDPTWLRRTAWRLMGGYGLRVASRAMQQDLADLAVAAEAS